MSDFYLDYHDPEEMQRAMEKKLAEKRKERIEKITSGELERIRVDRTRLNAIMDIRHFYCVKGSSVSADVAVKGSDIDGGIIVVGQRDKAKEDLCIFELQQQGFEVTHYDNGQKHNGIRFITQEEFDVTDWKNKSAFLDTSKEVGQY